VARSGDVGEIVRRALAYPYAVPRCSFVQLGRRTLELPRGGPDLAGRAPLIAYGSNAAPEALSRKLAALPALPIPVLRAELGGFDVVYSAHVSPYGAIPVTLEPSPGTVASVHVAYPNAEQLPLLSASEPNYELRQLSGLDCRLDGGAQLAEADAFLSRHGALSVAGAPLALPSIEASGRCFTEIDQAGVLELARARLAPEQPLEDFIVRCAGRGGIAPLPDLTPL